MYEFCFLVCQTNNNFIYSSNKCSSDVYFRTVPGRTIALTAHQSRTFSYHMSLDENNEQVSQCNTSLC